MVPSAKHPASLRAARHGTVLSGAEPKRSGRQLIVAVAGQPNTGKSTLFNKITGLRQRVGNWPGKTVDRAEGLVRRGQRSYLFVDLPGTYGLTANSPEEEVARDYLLSGSPDVILAVVNAASLERSMYLVAELSLLDTPLLVVLNMMDVAAQEGRRIDAQALARATGLPIVPMVGVSRQGAKELFETLEAMDLSRPRQHNAPRASAAEEQLAAQLAALAPLPYPGRWLAGKLLEQDKSIEARMETLISSQAAERLRAFPAKITESAREIYQNRQAWIDDVCAGAVHTSPCDAGITDRLDRILLDPLWGRILAFLVIPISCLLGVTLGMMTGGMALMAALSAGPGIQAAWPGIMGSLVANALVPALGWIAALASIIGFLYAIFHFLEDTGYLSRIACLMDPLLRWLGLDGKSAIPLLMGLLCNTVAVVGSRVVDTRRQRLVTLVMLPFLPCSGQTGVAVLFTFALFTPGTALLIILGVTALNILLAALAGKLVDSRLPSTIGNVLLMELPLYHKPNPATIFMGVRTRVELFLRHTAGYIVAALILVWAVSYFPDGRVESSYLYGFGRRLEPVGALLGFDWRFVVALLSSFVAKEATAGTLAVLFSVSVSDQQAVVQAIQNAISPQGALAFVVLSNVYLPCIATISALRSELGSWKTVAVLILAMLLTAFALAFAVSRAASVLL